MIFGKKMIEIYHEILAEIIEEGDVVVDATAGNGNDTEFLCRLVGDRGIVHAFDIQEEAINRTRARLEEAGLVSRAQLHLASHDRMDEFVTEPIKGFCFNLGYLPDGDKSIITQDSTTFDAVNKALKALILGGIGCILAYYGHEGGRKEMEIVDKLLADLPTKKYEVFRLENHNRQHFPPILYLVKRLK